MRALYLLSAFAWPVIALAQTDEPYTDAEAAKKAQIVIAQAHALHARVTEVCTDEQATGILYEVADEAVRHLDGWPRQSQKNRALAPYYSCRQSMLNVQTYAYTCANGGYKGKAEQYMHRQWLKDSASCDAALRTSGISLQGSN